MEEALANLKRMVTEFEELVPKVQQDALKNKKAYKELRELTLSARLQINIIREQAAEKYYKLYYAKWPDKRKEKHAANKAAGSGPEAA